MFERKPSIGFRPPLRPPRAYKAFADRLFSVGNCFDTRDDVIRYALQAISREELPGFIAFARQAEEAKISDRALVALWSRIVEDTYYIVPGMDVILKRAREIAELENADQRLQLRCAETLKFLWSRFPFGY